MKKYLLELVVFTSGAIVMIYELVGSRLFSPYLGSSLVVWTSLIGAIMASLSLGYYLGGIIVDKKASYSVLSSIVLMSAVSISFTAFLNTPILNVINSGNFDLRLKSLISAFIIFSPASLFFGMISPYAIKLKLNNLEESGAKIGGMYAISTFGSIFGTFAGGFFFIPRFGTMNILYILVIALIVLSTHIIITHKIQIKKIHLTCGILIISFLLLAQTTSSALAMSLVADIDTLYNRALIYNATQKIKNRPVRVFTIDPSGTQSAIFLDNDNDLVSNYLKYYRLAPHFKKEIKNALMIGGGVFTYPRDFLQKNPNANMDIVEIDSELINIAKKYFNYKDDTRVNIIHEGGRTFLNKNTKKYDVIFMDAFNAEYSIPFQLTTKEAIEKIYNSLNNDGVILANTITAFEGNKSRFLKAEIATYKSVFPQVYVFAVQEEKTSTEKQNIMIVALKSNKKLNLKNENPELNKYLSNIYKKDIILDLPILTDNYAPIDYYTLDK